MTTISLRSGDSLPGQLVSLFNFPGGLADDFTIQLQGGLTWSYQGLEPSQISGDVKFWSGHTILFTTHPDELSTPAIFEINTAYHTPAIDSGVINYSNLICYCNYAYSDGGLFNSSFENCLFFDGYGGLTSHNFYKSINNCTLVLMPQSDTETISASQQITNNLIVLYRAGLYTLNFAGGGTIKNNTIYNYSGGGQASSGGIDTVLGNPNLETSIYLQTASDFSYDNIATMLTRSAKLTAGSATCLGNADVATATTVDINGKTRG